MMSNGQALFIVIYDAYDPPYRHGHNINTIWYAGICYVFLLFFLDTIRPCYFCLTIASKTGMTCIMFTLQ